MTRLSLPHRSAVVALVSICAGCTGGSNSSTTGGSTSTGGSTTSSGTTGGRATTSGTTSGSSTSGGANVCGTNNFTVICDDAGTHCPVGATCLAGGGCECADSEVALTCEGLACSSIDGGCASPDWWCAPRVAGTCGAQNFTVICDGGYFCPASSSCVDGECGCEAGTLAVDCSATLCAAVDGGCAFPSWWCAMPQAGDCGAFNFTVPCDGGFNCPTDSVCMGTGCACASGFAPTTCSGAPCADAGCSFPNWWCH